MKEGKTMFGRKRLDSLGIDIQKNVVRYSIRRNSNWIYGEKIANGSFFKGSNLKNKEELRSILREIFKEIRVNTPIVTISVLNSKLLIRQIPLQDMETEAEIREFLFLELGESIQLPFDQPIFDLLILDKPTQLKEKTARKKKIGEVEELVKVKTIKRNRFAVNGNVPVVVTSEPLIEELGDAIKNSGGQLGGVDFSALAYTRIFKKKISWGQDFALVELDSGEATITIFEKFVPVYVQYEDYNQINWKYQEDGEEITSVFKEKIELQALEELGETINNLIQYYCSEISPTTNLEKIYLVGGHPWLNKEVLEQVQSRTAIPVATLNSSIKLKNQKRIPNRFLLATGLAMKEVR